MQHTDLFPLQIIQRNARLVRELMFIKQTLKILTQFIGFIKCGILSHSEWNKEKKFLFGFH